MKNLNVSVVIPNYNGQALLQKNLPSIIEASRNPKNRIMEVIIVDDGSKDKSVNVIKSKFPEVKLIKHTENRGFSASVNTGVRVAKGALVTLLNTDVSVSGDFLEKVVYDFEDPNVFGVSLNEGVYGWAKGKLENGFIVHTPGEKSDSAHITFWVSGGSGVFRRRIWSELKGMDEELFSPFYWEDLDLCYRVTKRGYTLLWEPEAKVSHSRESTIKSFSKNYVNYIWERNQLLFIWKNLTSWNLFRKHIVGVLTRIARHPGYIKVVFLALLKITKVFRKRAVEIKESKISDEAIFARFNNHPEK